MDYGSYLSLALNTTAKIQGRGSIGGLFDFDDYIRAMDQDTTDGGSTNDDYVFYLVNGIDNREKKPDSPWYMDLLKDGLIKEGYQEQDIHEIGAFHGKTGYAAADILINAGEVVLETVNYDVYTDGVVQEINELYDPESKKKIVIIGYSGGGRVAINAAQDLDYEVSNVISIGLTPLEFWVDDNVKDFDVIWNKKDPLSYGISNNLHHVELEGSFIGVHTKVQYFDSENGNRDRTMEIINQILQGN
jgi:hypothetical protein